jgi:hypothetical protein
LDKARRIKEQLPSHPFRLQKQISRLQGRLNKDPMSIKSCAIDATSLALSAIVTGRTTILRLR